MDKPQVSTKDLSLHCLQNNCNQGHVRVSRKFSGGHYKLWYCIPGSKELVFWRYTGSSKDTWSSRGPCYT